jgi:hypothetical protein
MTPMANAPSNSHEEQHAPIAASPVIVHLPMRNKSLLVNCPLLCIAESMNAVAQAQDAPTVVTATLFRATLPVKELEDRGKLFKAWKP